MSYKLTIAQRGGEEVEFLTIGEVAKLAGKSREALKKLMNRGILPDSNFRTPRVMIKRGLRKGEYVEGHRLYSKDVLVPKLVKFLRDDVTKGKQITIEQKVELINMFGEERKYYISNNEQ